MDPGRRAFLRGSLLTRAGRRAERARQHPLGPPPPWHQGLALEAHCPACSGPCVSACEPGIIRLHPADHERAGLPYLDFSGAGCTFCKACVAACPLEIDAAQEEPAPRPGTAYLDRSACIAWNDVICVACSTRCDYRAITTAYQRRPQVVEQRCTGCGMCVSACPVNALRIA